MADAVRLPTRFTELVGCAVPIQQAGMGVVSTPELAAAVTNAGGLGMLALPFGPARAVADAVDRVAAATTGGAFGVNFLMPFLDEAAVEVAAARARVVEFFYGDPAPALVERVRRGGALACWQVGSVQEAQAATDAGCDFVVVQGSEAGGHVRGTTPLLPLLDAVLDRVEVPVVAAGGITTARSVAAVLAAGADAARVGTRFLASSEADVHPDYVRALIEADDAATVLTDAFGVGWPDAPHRVLRSCVDAARELATDVAGEAGGALPHPVVRFSAEPPTRETRGTIAAMALYAGAGVGALNGVQPAGDIVRELVEGVAARLRGPV